MELVEQQYGTGFVEKEIQSTDRVFSASNSEPVDWQKGFDVRDELKKKLGSGFIIPVNDQARTQSCVAQAWAKYAGIKKVMGDPNPNWVEFSPRDLYSHIYLPQGGSYVMAGGLRCKNSGILPYEQLPSHWSAPHPDLVPTEEVMRDPGIENDEPYPGFPDIDPHVYDGLRQLVKGGSIEILGYSMESIAQATRDNYGSVIGLYGENNGTWLSKYPRTGNKSWGHGILVIGYIYINGKKYIKILNSWGTGCGEGGVQYLGEEWFQTGGPTSFTYLGGAFTWSPEVGRFHRVADYEKLDLYIKNNYSADFNVGVPETWKMIQKMTGLDITYSDYSNYMYLIKIK